MKAKRPPAVSRLRVLAVAILLFNASPAAVYGQADDGELPPDAVAPTVETTAPAAGTAAPPAGGGPEGVTAEDPAAAVRPSNAAFMKPLGRLSSILGSVHFLRTLCGDEGAAVWREKMSELIAAQAPNEADRRLLVAGFNEGYRAFESTYRKCTPAARVAVDRYLKEGATLAREISARYGD